MGRPVKRAHLTGMESLVNKSLFSKPPLLAQVFAIGLDERKRRGNPNPNGKMHVKCVLIAKKTHPPTVLCYPIAVQIRLRERLRSSAICPIITRRRGTALLLCGPVRPRRTSDRAKYATGNAPPKDTPHHQKKIRNIFNALDQR